MLEVLQNKIKGKDGDIGQIILNRPKALNSLTMDMLDLLHEHLDEYESNKKIKAVVIKSNCERSFCAGGDLKKLYESIRNNIDPAEFFKKEYALNAKIFHYKKPYIALLDGVTMGGGVGISIHGSHRIATENLKFAMPETTIGLYPDAGTAYQLSRAPNNLGMFLGLTGNTITSDDAYNIGVVTHIIKQNDIDAIEKTLVENTIQSKADVDELLKPFKQIAQTTELSKLSDIVKQQFGLSSVAEIISSLQKDTHEYCQQLAKYLLKRSPTSLKVTFKHLTKAANMTFDEVIDQDLTLSINLTKGHDFLEGVRAKMIDKDHLPQWQPQNLESVTDEIVDRYF